MTLSTYWEQVRNGYRAFESDFRAGTSDVYNHEIPGGQYTNLREQARAMGIDDQHWPEVSRTYAEVNRMFGDIVKVTPSSKVVGDMALMMVTSGLTPDDVADPDREIAFPESVVSLFAGELGQPHGGFPPALQDKILKGREPITVRPGSAMPDADLEAGRKEAEQAAERPIADAEFASWLMYPQVFADYAARQRDYGDISVLPTPVYFYGMEAGEEIAVDIERGRTLIVRYLARSEPDRKGECTVFFEAQRATTHGAYRRPKRRRRGRGAPQGRGGQCRPCRRADARHGGQGLLQRGRGGRGGRRAGRHRGDEDGDRDPRRAGRNRLAGRRARRHYRGDQGPAGRRGRLEQHPTGRGRTGLRRDPLALTLSPTGERGLGSAFSLPSPLPPAGGARGRVGLRRP